LMASSAQPKASKPGRAIDDGTVKADKPNKFGLQMQISNIFG